MKGLFKVSRPETEPIGWDEFDSFVCVAEDVESARRMHPRNHYVWNKRSGGWHFRSASGDIETNRCEYHGWTTHLNSLEIECLTTAGVELPVGRIVVSSFNAG
jgi:hypothetical protein